MPRFLLVADKEDKKSIGIMSATEIIEYVMENSEVDHVYDKVAIFMMKRGSQPIIVVLNPCTRYYPEMPRRVFLRLERSYKIISS